MADQKQPAPQPQKAAALPQESQPALKAVVSSLVTLYVVGKTIVEKKDFKQVTLPAIFDVIKGIPDIAAHYGSLVDELKGLEAGDKSTEIIKYLSTKLSDNTDDDAIIKVIETVSQTVAHLASDGMAIAAAVKGLKPPAAA